MAELLLPLSLWVFHARSVPQNGLNPFIRTLFFKILKLLQYPVLLLFVFDGPHKPAMKRGNKVAGRFGRGDRESLQFKLLLDEMGLEYWDVSYLELSRQLDLGL
jgi:Holliday junction resolvase YEN1